MITFSSGTPANTRLSYVRRRLQLLDIAWQLIEQNGLVCLSFCEIAKQASITTSAIYRYFASKEIMLIELRDIFSIKKISYEIT